MRRMVFTSVFLAVGGLIGCQQSKEQVEQPFVSMPADMATSVKSMWKDAPPAQGATPSAPASSPADKP